MSIRASRRSLSLGLAPSAVSAALLVSGLAISLGAASLGFRRGGPEVEATLSAYDRASWQISAAGGGLSSILYLGHLLGPMLVLAAFVHARVRHRERLDDEALSPWEEDVPAATDLDAPRTLRRISVVLPHAEAVRLAESLRTSPEHAHRAIGPLSTVIERVGELEHVEHVIDRGDDGDALLRERRTLDRRLGESGLGGALSGYREHESVPPALAGEHAILSWVLVTRSDLDPLVDVPTAGRTQDWLTELVPIRPEQTVLVEAFVTPRASGADRDALGRALSLEPLRGRAG